MSTREWGCLFALVSLSLGLALLCVGVGAGATALMYPDAWRALLPEGFGETWVGVAIAMAAIPAGVFVLKMNPNEGKDEDEAAAERERSPSAWIGLFSSLMLSGFIALLLTSAVWPMVFPSGDGESMSWDAVRASEPGWNFAGFLLYGIPFVSFLGCFLLFVLVSPSADQRALVEAPKRALERRAAARYARAADAIAKEQQAGGVTMSRERGERGGVSEV